MRSEVLEVTLASGETVSGLFAACYVMSLGAGAGMAHLFMVVAGGLAQRGVATLRYQVPAHAKGFEATRPTDGSASDGCRWPNPLAVA